MTVQEGSSGLPDMRHYSDVPMFNTKAVVQQTGVPAPTLRAWERRYRLLSPERANNDYRLYSERDIFMIHWLKERVDSGMAISQAVALFRHMSKSQQHGQQDTSTPPEHLSLPLERESSPAFQIILPQFEQNHIATKQGNGTTVQDVDQRPADDATETGSESQQERYPSLHNMRNVRERLLTTFSQFDEPMASMLMASMLAIYPLEQVCTELITPTMWQIGQLWDEGQLSVATEHFASTFFRALLTNLLHATPDPESSPFAIVCSAPGEPHELAPLMLSLFLRRSGVRIAYLGQSIETAGLLHTIKKISPTLICISLTIPVHLPALIDLGNRIHMMPEPHPIFAFGGQVFARYPDAIQEIRGTYLNGDMKTSVRHLKDMMNENTPRLP